MTLDLCRDVRRRALLRYLKSLSWSHGFAPFLLAGLAVRAGAEVVRFVVEVDLGFGFAVADRVERVTGFEVFTVGVELPFDGVAVDVLSDGLATVAESLESPSGFV